MTLDEAKLQCNIVLSDTSYDDQLILYMQTASAAILGRLSKTLSDYEIDTSPITYDVPLEIKQAVLCGVAELWTNRESSSVNILSDGVLNLIVMHYRRGWA